MLQAVVIKTAGDPAVTRQILRGLEATEARRLRAENRQLRRRDAIFWAERLADADRKYARAIRPHSRLYKTVWSLIGMAVMLRQERRDAA